MSFPGEDQKKVMSDAFMCADVKVKFMNIKKT